MSDDDAAALILRDLGPKHPLHEMLSKHREYGITKHGQPLSLALTKEEIEAYAQQAEYLLVKAAVYLRAMHANKASFQTLGAVLALQIALRPDGESGRAFRDMPVIDRLRSIG